MISKEYKNAIIKIQDINLKLDVLVKNPENNEDKIQILNSIVDLILIKNSLNIEFKQNYLVHKKDVIKYRDVVITDLLLEGRIAQKRVNKKVDFSKSSYAESQLIELGFYHAISNDVNSFEIRDLCNFFLVTIATIINDQKNLFTELNPEIFPSTFKAHLNFYENLFNAKSAERKKPETLDDLFENEETALKCYKVLIDEGLINEHYTYQNKSKAAFCLWITILKKKRPNGTPYIFIETDEVYRKLLMKKFIGLQVSLSTFKTQMPRAIKKYEENFNEKL